MKTSKLPLSALTLLCLIGLVLGLPTGDLQAADGCVLVAAKDALVYTVNGNRRALSWSAPGVAVDPADYDWILGQIGDRTTWDAWKANCSPLTIGALWDHIDAICLAQYGEPIAVIKRINPQQVELAVVPDPLAAAAAADVTSGEAPLAVQFSGAATGGTAPYSWSWQLGDGATDAAQNPAHTYAAGDFTAVLTVTDAAGQTATDSVAISVTDTAPPPPPPPPAGGCVLVAAKDALVYTVSGARRSLSWTAPGLAVDPADYDWILGQLNSRTTWETWQANCSPITIAALQDFINVLCLAQYGEPVASIKRINPQDVQLTGDPPPPPPPPPLAVTGDADPDSGEAPLTVNFTAQAAGGAPPYSWAWDFGDGNSSALQNPTHTYETAGDFTASVTVSDGAGGAESASLAISASDAPPPPPPPPPPLAVTAGADVTNGATPLAVNFTAQAAGGTGNYSYHWDFGGDGTSGAQNPAHTFNAAGTFDCVVTVSDGQASAQAPVRIVTVDPGFRILVLTQATEVSVELFSGRDVTLTWGPPGAEMAMQDYDWLVSRIGLRTNLDDFFANAPSSVGGLWAFCNVLALEQYGDSIMWVNRIKIQALELDDGSTPMSIDAAAAPLNAETPLFVEFSAKAAGGMFPYSYAWDFGDGQAADQANVEHHYSVPGTYQATVTATDRLGQRIQQSFTLAAPAGPDPLIAIQEPLGGEQWATGSRQAIVWTSDGPIAAVDIAVSRDGGAHWTTLAAGAPNNGAWAWTVTGPETAALLVAVSASDASARDELSSPLAIVAPGADTVVDLAATGLARELPLSPRAVPGSEEDAPGAFVHFNADNDNDSAGGTTAFPGGDYLETGPVAGEDDLLPLTITVLPALPTTGQLVLRRDNNRAQVWSSADKDPATAILTGSSYSGTVEGNGRKTWDLAQPAQRAQIAALMNSLFVEGRDDGQATISLAYEQGGVAVAADQVLYNFIAATCGSQPTVAVRDAWEGWFPENLVRGEWSVLKPADWNYNCIAWTVGDTSHWIWTEIDDVYGDNDGEMEIADWDAFYLERKGYVPTTDPEEAEVVLYGSAGPDGQVHIGHGARRQYDSCGAGQWLMFSSKNGDAERAEHRLEALNGYFYGQAVRFYRKP